MGAVVVEEEGAVGADAGADIHCAGHIPGAINVAWNENMTSSAAPVFRSIDDLRAIYSEIPDGDTIIVYCRTGMQACVDYFVLRYLGRDVHLYDGSYIEWSRDEYGT